MEFISTYISGTEDYLERAFYYFFGSAFILPGADIQNTEYINGELFFSVLGGFQSGWESAVLFALLLSMVFSIFFGLRNFAMKFLLISFFVDVLIHLIFRLGLSEAYIFQGNYMFIWPLILGIGYKKWSETKLKNYFQMIILLLFFLILKANFNVLCELYAFGVSHYPAN